MRKPQSAGQNIYNYNSAVLLVLETGKPLNIIRANVYSTQRTALFTNQHKQANSFPLIGRSNIEYIKNSDRPDPKATSVNLKDSTLDPLMLFQQ